MDKNILDFINLAKSKDETRYQLCHAYANEKHIVALDGHRMHYVDNAWGMRGFLCVGTTIDAQFPNYEKLIFSLPCENYNAITIDGSGKDSVNLWKSALKEIRTFDHAYFEMRDGELFLCAKNHIYKKIQKTLSMHIKDCKVCHEFKRSPTVNAQYLSDALSPITHKRLAVKNYFTFCADISEKYPMQLRVETPDGIFRSVLMTIRDTDQAERIAN